MENQTTTQLNPTQLYLTKVFDGVFSETDISNHRARVFYRIVNFTSPKSGAKVGDILSADEVGEIINELDTLQFNRKIAMRVAKLEEANF